MINQVENYLIKAFCLFISKFQPPRGLGRKECSEYSSKNTQTLAQQVKDPALSLLWIRSLLWHGFNLWPRKFYMPQVQPKKKKKKKKENPDPWTAKGLGQRETQLQLQQLHLLNVYSVPRTVLNTL